jgi:signal transduction histidine kinase
MSTIPQPQEPGGAADATDPAPPAAADIDPPRSATLLSAVADAPVNILIVDDEPNNLAVLEAVLDTPGYRLVRAESADQALLSLVSEEFALLILDIRMPGMTGFELAQTIKGRRKTSRIPIIFLTAYYNEDQHVLEGYGSGAVDYLVKPINPTVLRSKVAVFVELHRKGREVANANRALLAEVSERRRAEQQLHELNANLDRLVAERTQALAQLESELRATDRRKDAFIATLAHELRNPLAPVRNAVRILQLPAPPEDDVQRAKAIISRQVAIMARLLDDLMDVSRINRGRIDLRREPVELRRVLDIAIETTRAPIADSGLTLRVDLPAEPIVLNADVTRLSQVFVNLLTNAAKYTERGGRISLSVRRGEKDIHVAVTDSGIGIPPDQLDRVFDMFAQVEDSIGRSRGGLGIGLSLVRHLVALHGGAVWADSDGPGKGSTFVVTLPLPVATASSGTSEFDSTDQPMGAEGGLRILVVDDHRDGADTIATLLSCMGHEVRKVNDGDAALQEAAAFRPQMVLLDIGLPTLSGYEVCQRIRQESWGRSIMIVAMTGWGDREAQNKVRAAGFDRHLVKPIDEAGLQEALHAAAARG